jgi:5-methylcytosine-specific restriction endonuclease McrA
MLRHCTICKRDVELSEWHRHSQRHRRGGKGANKQQKKAAKARAGYACANCGRSDLDLEVHHIDGNWRNNTWTNLIALCPPCHVDADAEVQAAREQHRDIDHRPRTYKLS